MTILIRGLRWHLSRFFLLPRGSRYLIKIYRNEVPQTIMDMIWPLRLGSAGVNYLDAPGFGVLRLRAGTVNISGSFRVG